MSLKELWRKLSPLSRGLIGFGLVNCAGVSLALHFLHRDTTNLHYMLLFLRAHAYADSWTLMRQAWEFLKKSNDGSLYADLFFRQNVKFINPPTALLIFEPMTWGGSDAPPSNRLLNGISWLAVIGTAIATMRLFVRAAREYPYGGAADEPTEKIARVVLPLGFSLAFYPLTRSFYLGNIQTWITFLFATAAWAWMDDRKGLSGSLCALICLIKPQLGLLALWGALRREWRFVTGWALVGGALLSLSLADFGLKNHLDYLRVLSYISKHGEAFVPNQSVNGLLNRLLSNGDSARWDPHNYAPYHRWVYAGGLASSLTLIGFALFWRRREHRRAGLTDFFIAALSFTMASPVAWEHHYAILLPIFAVVLPATLVCWSGRGMILLLAVSYALSSNHYALPDETTRGPWSLLQSYLFFGAALLIGHLYLLRARQQVIPQGVPGGTGERPNPIPC